MNQNRKSLQLLNMPVQILLLKHQSFPKRRCYARTEQRRNLDGKGESDSPSRNFLLEVVDLLYLARSNPALEVLKLVVLLGQLTLDLLAQLDASIDVVGNPLEVLLTQTARGHGWSANTDTHWCEGGLVTRCGVLVASDVDLLEHGFDTRTVQSEGLEVDKDHVVVSTVGDEVVVLAFERYLKCLGVLDDLLLVELEVLGLSLLERNRERGDGVVVRATLVTREDGEVDGTFEIVERLLAGLSIGLAYTLAEEDHGTTGSTKGLVSGGRDDVAVREGRLVDTSGDQTGDMGHVHQEVAADLVRDLTHAGVVDFAAVGGGTGDEHLGAVHEGVLLELVVVDEAGVEVHTVGEGLEVCGNS
jgi:hypothetical protein